MQKSLKAKQKTTVKPKKTKVENSDSKAKDEVLASMSVEQFLASGFDSDEESDTEVETPVNDTAREDPEVSGKTEGSSEEEEEDEEEDESSEGMFSYMCHSYTTIG